MRMHNESCCDTGSFLMCRFFFFYFFSACCSETIGSHAYCCKCGSLRYRSNRRLSFQMSGAYLWWAVVWAEMTWWVFSSGRKHRQQGQRDGKAKKTPPKNRRVLQKKKEKKKQDVKNDLRSARNAADLNPLMPWNTDCNSTFFFFCK